MNQLTVVLSRRPNVLLLAAAAAAVVQLAAASGTDQRNVLADDIKCVGVTPVFVAGQQVTSEIYRCFPTP